MAKVAAFDDPVRFEHNVMAVKMLQASGDPLSRVETQQFKDFWTCLNPESNPYCYEILLDVQAAQFMVQEAQAIEDFKTRRDEGHLLGGQIDAWTRWGRKFMCFNYTYLKLGVVETDEGLKPRWSIKTAILCFEEWGDHPQTAEAITEWLNGVLKKHNLTWADFALLVPDGASNCIKTLNILVEDVDSCVCYCHDLARAVLYAIGMGAALEASDRDDIDELTSALNKMRTLSIKFSRVSALKKACHDSQAQDGIKRELETLRAAITRWNGVYLGLLRNIQLKVKKQT